MSPSWSGSCGGFDLACGAGAGPAVAALDRVERPQHDRGREPNNFFLKYPEMKKKDKDFYFKILFRSKIFLNGMTRAHIIERIEWDISIWRDAWRRKFAMAVSTHCNVKNYSIIITIRNFNRRRISNNKLNLIDLMSLGSRDVTSPPFLSLPLLLTVLKQLRNQIILVRLVLVHSVRIKKLWKVTKNYDLVLWLNIFATHVPCCFSWAGGYQGSPWEDSYGNPVGLRR